MGIAQTHALGRDLRFFCKEETTRGTWEKIGTTDEAKVLSVSMAAERTRRNREDNRATRSLLERIQGKGTVSWSAETYVMPSGTAGTPPDVGPMLEAALGTYTNTPSTSDAYTLADSQQPITLTLLRSMSAVLQETVWGAWVDEAVLSVQGGEEPKFRFSGGAMGYTLTGVSTLNGAMSASTTMVVQTADQHAFGENSLVSIDDTDNVAVTVDTSRPSFTVDTSVTEDDAAAVVPYVPAEGGSGSPIAGITGSVTYDSDGVDVTGFELSIRNGFRAIEDEAMQEYPADFTPGYREVGGQLTLRARKDWVVHVANRRDFGLQAITVVLGSVAGSILTVSVPYAELDYAAIDVPAGDGDVMLTLPFVALASSSGEDECSLTFT